MYNKKKNERKLTTKQNKRVIAEISCVPTARRHTHAHTHKYTNSDNKTNARFVLHLSAKQLTLSLSPSIAQLNNSLSEQLNSWQCALSALSQRLRSLFLLSLSCMGEALCLYMVRFHFVLIPLCLT